MYCPPAPTGTAGSGTAAPGRTPTGPGRWCCRPAPAPSHRSSPPPRSTGPAPGASGHTVLGYGWLRSHAERSGPSGLSGAGVGSADVRSLALAGDWYALPGCSRVVDEAECAVGQRRPGVGGVDNRPIIGTASATPKPAASAASRRGGGFSSWSLLARCSNVQHARWPAGTAIARIPIPGDAPCRFRCGPKSVAIQTLSGSNFPQWVPP